MSGAPPSLFLAHRWTAVHGVARAPKRLRDTAKSKELVDGWWLWSVIAVLISRTAEAIRRVSAGIPPHARRGRQAGTEVRNRLPRRNREAAEKIEVNEADLTRSVDDQEKKVKAQFKTETEFRQALKENGFGSYDEWRKMQTDLLRRDNLQKDLITKLRRDGKMTAVNVSEAEVTATYEENKARLPRKEARVGIRQIVLATKPSEASKKRARALAGSVR
jgi:hypothetical protein